VTSLFRSLLICVDDPAKYWDLLRSEVANVMAYRAKVRILLVRPRPVLAVYSASNALGLRYAANALQRKAAAAESSLRELVQCSSSDEQNQASLHVLDEQPSAECIANLALAESSDRVVIALDLPGDKLAALRADVEASLLDQGRIALIISVHAAA